MDSFFVDINPGKQCLNQLLLLLQRQWRQVLEAVEAGLGRLKN